MRRFMPAATASALFFFLPLTQASDWRDKGHVVMRGAIHQGACAIKTEDVEQTIAMGVLPLARMQRDGKGPAHPFSIQLVNCQMLRSETGAITRAFTIAFESNNPGTRQNFAVTGDAQGVDLMITDINGKAILPGALQAIDVHLTQQFKLQYRLFLVSNLQQLSAGNFAAAIRFHINYN